MRSRFARLGVVAVGLLALLATSAPPANAITHGKVVFVGTANISGGLSYPCVGTATQDLNLCPQNQNPTLNTDLPLTHGPLSVIPNGHIGFGHNQRNIVFVAANVCVVADVNVTKTPAKAPVHANPGCSFTIVPDPLNTVTGSCGLSGGQVKVDFNDGLGQTIHLDIHFNGVGGLLVLTGHAHKDTGNQSGKIWGKVAAAPVPVPTIPTLGNSCSSKTASEFTIAGYACVILLPLSLT